MAPADDEAEVARPRDPDDARRGLGGERADDRAAVGRRLGCRTAERGAQLGQRRVGADGSGLERAALRVDELPDLRQELAELGHDPSRSFRAKIASIGPGSTSFSSAR